MSTPKQRPILFNGPMIRASLENRKTQTRRIINPQPFETQCAGQQMFGHEKLGGEFGACVFPGCFAKLVSCPHGQPGDRLWVRETFKLCESTRADGHRAPLYRATSIVADEIKWNPSIFMPRWASRITLEITSVRVERVREISEDDAMAEGIEGIGQGWKDYGKPTNSGKMVLPRDSFRSLWNSINAKRGFGWDSNPWVWAITFRKL